MNETKENSSLPEDWKWVKLGDSCEVITGTTPPKSDPSNYGNDISFFKPPHLWDKLISDTEEKLSAKGAKKARVVPANTVLVTCIGNLGRTGLLKKPAAFNQQLNAIIENEEIIGKFIFYQAQSPKFKKQLEELATGTTVSIVNKRNFETILIPVPSKAIQQAIVSKIEELFSELDKSIETLRLAQQQLKTYRQAILKLAFEGKLTNENIKESELPEGWVITALNQVCKISGGITKGRNFKGKETMYLPYLRVANVQDGYLDLREVKQIEILETEKEKYQLKLGDILYTEGGDKDKLGRGTIWKNEIPNCVHQNHIFKARPLSSDINSSYIAYYSQTQSAKNYFFKHGKQTTNLASINLTILSNLQLPLCSITEQNNIVQIIEVKFSIADNMEESIKKSLQQSEVLRQCILKMAFEGKLIDNSLIKLQKADWVEPQHEENKHGLDDKKNTTNQKTIKKRIMINELKSIIEILAESSDPLSAKDVWQTSIHKDDIDAFYSQLKKEVENGNVIEKQRTGRESFLILTKAK